MPNELSRNEYVRAIFGSTHRLDIWAKIVQLNTEPPERFYANEIIDDLDGIGLTRLGDEMQNLERLGMIKRNHDGGYQEGKTRGRPPKWFVRCDSPAWQIVEVALHAVEVEFPSPVE